MIRFSFTATRRFAPGLQRLFCLLVVAALTRCGVAQASPAADGWQKLWQNQDTAARAAFRMALKQNPSDPEALRGLGLLSFQEDAEGAALQAWRPLYRLAPGHWSAVAYWPRLVELARRTGSWTLLEGAARDVLAAKSAPPELKASARLALADTAFRAGRQAEAEAQWSALGYVRAWRVIGPFDNVSRSGFEKAYPPERSIDFAKSYPGKDDLALHWYRLASVTRDGQCEVSASLGDEAEDLFYAATALFSPKDQAALIRFDPSGATRISLNGRLVFSDDVYRQHQPLTADSFRIPVTLHHGWNTVLIKLADDESIPAQFAFRVTAPDSADGLRLPADPAHVTSTASSLSPPPASLDTVSVSLLRKAAPGEEAAAALADHLRRARDYHAAAEVLKAALAKSPSSGWLHWELSQTLQEDEQVDEARAERDLARKDNPGIVAAELGALEDKEEALRPAERIQRLKALQKRSPASAQVAWALAHAYDAAGLISESMKAARGAVASAGGPEEIARLIALYRRHGRKADAESMLASALRAAPHEETLLREQARLLEQQGKTAAAVALYQRLMRINGTVGWYRLQLVGLYQAAGNLKSAAQALRVAREQRPQAAHVCALLADVYREMGRSAEAIQLYRVAIRLAPAQVDLREKLQLLSGERPVVDLAPATPAAPILAKTPRAADVAGASSVVLLDETRQVVYPDYATVSRVHRIVKVFDAAAVDRYQQFPLGVSSASSSATVESARLIKADGKVQDVTDEDSAGSVSLPSLAAGDVIDVTYRMEDYPQGGLARQFWTEWYFAEPGTPVKLSRYVLITPPGMSFQTRGHGGVPEPVVKDVKGWRIREWRMSDIAAQKPEVSAPGLTDTGSWLDISTISSWRQIVEWYQDLSHPRCLPDAAISAKAAELTRGAKTEEEKLRALVAFVSREVQYQTTPFRLSAYVPTDGKQVLRERYGDCKDKAALLTALLAAVGIKANMVLLSGRSHGITPYLPSPRFAHAIALVHTSTGPVWVDATADQMEFGGFPSDDQQVPALVIDDATTDLVITPALPVEKDRIVETSQVALGADGRLSGSFQLAATGDWGWILRSILRRVPEASREQALRGMATQITENCRYESGSMDHLSEPDQPLTLAFKYHVERYSSTAGNFLLARLPWGIKTDAADSLLADAQRQEDVETALDRGDFRSSVRIELPAGYTPQDLQPEVHGESPWGSYRFTYRLEGSVLQAESEVTMTPLRVARNEFPQYIEFLRAIDKEMRNQLVLKKP